MFAGFVKPGKHRVIIYDPDPDCEKPNWYKRDFYVDEMQGSVPRFIKLDEEEFVKEVVLNSILKDWKTDNPNILEQCLAHDESLWKVEKYIKDKDDY